MISMKEIHKQISEEIAKSNRILLTCHPSPDPDSVGSNLAMKIALEQLGKKVTLIQGDSEIPKAFQFPGVETITRKSYGEIDINDFDLFIILDINTLDRITSKEKIVFPDSLSTILIDHHMGNEGFGKINWTDTSYAATAQMLLDLFKEMEVKIDHDIALSLFIGIYTDTGGFRYGNSNDKALRAAAELSIIAPDYGKTIFTMENSSRKESLVFEGLALYSLQTFFDDKLAMTSVTYEQIQKNNLIEEDIFTGYISNKLKSVIGFEIGTVLVEMEPNVIKVGFRTRDQNKYDLSKIALALGGGGHKGAAGATLNMTMDEAKEKVVKTVKEIYNL